MASDPQNAPTNPSQAAPGSPAASGTTRAQPAADAPVEIQTGPDPQRCVIWLHGLGADGHDFEPIVPELQLQGAAALRFVFPHAPVRPVTVNRGMPMRAWYDIAELGGRMRQDSEGIRASQASIQALIARENARGVADGHIVIAGFSQGGAIALQTALRHPRRLAGVLALSTYLPLADTLAAERSPANQDIPILMAHGIHDPVVPHDMGALSRRNMEALGYSVNWKEYPMQHSLCAPQVRDIAAWLRTVLSL